MKRRSTNLARVLPLAFLVTVLVCLLSFVTIHLFRTHSAPVSDTAVASTSSNEVHSDDTGHSASSQDASGDEPAGTCVPEPLEIDDALDYDMDEDVGCEDDGGPSVPDAHQSLMPDAQEEPTASRPVDEAVAQGVSDDVHLDADVEEAPGVDVGTPDSSGIGEAVGTARVPAPPTILDAFAYVPQIIITGSDEPVYDDDFFATFFVQGQDTLEYDDGLYYFMFTVDDETMGNLEILFQDGERLMNTSQLQMYLSGLLTDSAYRRLLVDGVGDYVSIRHFEDNGVRVTYDEVGFTIDMAFSLEDMPERVISLSGGSWSRRSYSLSGAQPIEPDWFSWRTGYNLYTSLDWAFDDDLFGYSVNLAVSNYLTLGPVDFDFFYNLGVRNDEFHFSWNSYRFFYDFVDEGIRLSWGNVYGFGQSPQGTPLGVQFEKSYSYGSITSPGNSHREYVTIVEESYIWIVRNGRIVFHRLLQPGNYRLEDFTFDSGYNEIEIVVTPSRLVDPSLDRSDPQVLAMLEDVSYRQYFDMSYDSQLLSRGETLFGGSINIGRSQIDVGNEDEATGLLLRVSPQYYYDYHLDDVVISWYQDVGLSDEMTLMSDFSMRIAPDRGILDASVALRRAWLLGTTTLSADGILDSAAERRREFDFQARLDHSFLFDWTVVRGVSTSISYANSSYNSGEGDRLSFRLSFSGSLGFLRYSASGNLVVDGYDLDRSEWRVSTSFSVSPMRNLGISAGITASQSLKRGEDVGISGYLTASFSFGGRASGSYSTGFTGTHSLSTSFSVGNRDSFSASLSGFDFGRIDDHTLSGSWYHSGDLFGLSVRASAYDRYDRLNLSASLSSASYFSGGVFGISRSVRDSFVLIRPRGSLSGAQIQVARSNQGSAQDIDSVFGTGVYSSLSSYQRNNIVVYVTGDDEFAETQTFAYELNPDNRSGYSIRISVPQEYTVSGLLAFDGVVQNTFSSPVYRVVEDEDGGLRLEGDISLYLFADQDGRFIISGVEPGTYVFDVEYDGLWYAVRFDVEALDDDELRVVDYGTLDFDSDMAARHAFSFDGTMAAEGVDGYLSGYQGLVDISPVRIIDSATFWNELFPPLTDDEISQDFGR